MDSIKSKIEGFFEKPYSDDMDVTGWILFLGLVALISLAWTRVLKKIQEV